MLFTFTPVLVSSFQSLLELMLLTGIQMKFFLGVTQNDE